MQYPWTNWGSEANILLTPNTDVSRWKETGAWQQGEHSRLHSAWIFLLWGDRAKQLSQGAIVIETVEVWSNLSLTLSPTLIWTQREWTHPDQISQTTQYDHMIKITLLHWNDNCNCSQTALWALPEFRDPGSSPNGRLILTFFHLCTLRAQYFT